MSGILWWPNASPLFDWHLKKEGFQPAVPSQCWEMAVNENYSYIFMLPQINPACYRLKLFQQRKYIDGLVQERRNSIANALELRLSCTNPLICRVACFSFTVHSLCLDIILPCFVLVYVLCMRFMIITNMYSNWVNPDTSLDTVMMNKITVILCLVTLIYC